MGKLKNIQEWDIRDSGLWCKAGIDKLNSRAKIPPPLFPCCHGAPSVTHFFRFLLLAPVAHGGGTKRVRGPTRGPRVHAWRKGNRSIFDQTCFTVELGSSNQNDLKTTTQIINHGILNNLFIIIKGELLCHYIVNQMTFHLSYCNKYLPRYLCYINNHFSNISLNNVQALP